MDKDRIKGSAEQAKGKVKEWAGKITGDSKTEAEGKADQVKARSRIRSAESKTRCAANKGLTSISILEPRMGLFFWPAPCC